MWPAAEAAEKVGKTFGKGWGIAFGGEVGRELSAPAGAATWEAQHNRSSCGEAFGDSAGVAAAAAVDQYGTTSWMMWLRLEPRRMRKDFREGLGKGLRRGSRA